MESTSSPKSKRKLQNGDDREEVTQKLFTIQTSDYIQTEDTPLEIIDTMRLPAQAEIGVTQETPTIPLKTKQRPGITRGKATLYIALLLIVVLNALTMSYAHFIGPQGWAFVIGGPVTTGSDNYIIT